MDFGATLCADVQNYVFDLEESPKNHQEHPLIDAQLSCKVHGIPGLHQAWPECVPILGKVHSFPSTKLNPEGTIDESTIIGR